MAFLLLVSCSVVSDFATPWTAPHQLYLLFTISQSCKNSCPLNHWCHPTISPSVVTFSSCPQYFPGSFPMSQLFVSGGQSFSASASVLPMNIEAWFPLGLTDLISLLPKGFSRVFSSTTNWKHWFFDLQPSLWSNSHICTYLPERP